MEATELKRGEIMQISPESTNEAFRACLLVVDEPKPWGCQGYVQNAGQEGQAYVRVKWEDMEPTGGMAQWVVA
jgi:hypothetical protein